MATKLTHEDLQTLLDKHPDFQWAGQLGRRDKTQETFVLGKAKALDLSEKDRKTFTIRSHRDHLAWELRNWLLARIGEVVSGDGPVSLPLDLIADARRLRDE
jgi:hypothetical protein